MKFHVKLAGTRQSPEGKPAFEVGLKAGYWPCLRGPFVAIALGHQRLDIWYGLPSYWHNGQPPENPSPSSLPLVGAGGIVRGGR